MALTYSGEGGRGEGDGGAGGGGGERERRAGPLRVNGTETAGHGRTCARHQAPTKARPRRLQALVGCLLWSAASPLPPQGEVGCPVCHALAGSRTPGQWEPQALVPTEAAPGVRANMRRQPGGGCACAQSTTRRAQAATTGGAANKTGGEGAPLLPFAPKRPFCQG